MMAACLGYIIRGKKLYNQHKITYIKICAFNKYKRMTTSQLLKFYKNIFSL